MRSMRWSAPVGPGILRNVRARRPRGPGGAPQVARAFLCSPPA
jgi:hypothetical protein